jgi:hypothetical protein
MTWRCRIPTWKARQLQEAAEVIPTLQQQRGDVISARVYERLRVLVRQRRRSPSSHRNSHLGQCRAESPHKVPCQPNKSRVSKRYIPQADLRR